MGLADGEQVRIYGGARVVGRVGEWDVGLLDIQTAQSEMLPSENQGVLRLRRRVLNSNSYVGGILTSRLGTNGRGNVVYGLDGIFRLFGQDYLTLNWARASTTSSRHPTVDRSESSIGVCSAHAGSGVGRMVPRTLSGLPAPGRSSILGSVSCDGVTSPRRRVISVTVGGLREDRAASSSLVLNVDGSLFRRNADGTVESGEVTTTAVLETNGQHRWTLSLPVRHENVETDFNPGGADAVVPAGRYRFTAVGLAYRPPQGLPFRPTLRAETGEFYDGRATSLSFSPSWSASKHLSLSGSYGVDLVSFPDRGESFTAHVGGLRAEVMFSTALSLVTFIQYNSTRDAVLANFRVRYNPREGNDLYVVWNEGVFTDTSSFDPVRPWADQRTILIKYSHTIPFGA